MRNRVLGWKVTETSPDDVRKRVAGRLYVLWKEKGHTLYQGLAEFWESLLSYQRYRGQKHVLLNAHRVSHLSLDSCERKKGRGRGTIYFPISGPFLLLFSSIGKSLHFFFIIYYLICFDNLCLRKVEVSIDNSALLPLHFFNKYECTWEKCFIKSLDHMYQART